jgi:hypothetical protein
VGEREEREREREGARLGREEVGPERKERPKGRGISFYFKICLLSFCLENCFEFWGKDEREI